MSEVATFNTLRGHASRPGDRWDRVENMAGIGMPDCSITLHGLSPWLEIKSPKDEPKRASTPLLRSRHKLSIDQRNWILRHIKAGGTAFVYIDAPSRRYLIHGRHADRVNDATQGELFSMADWCAPRRCPTAAWDDFRDKLMAR